MYVVTVGYVGHSDDSAGYHYSYTRICHVRTLMGQRTVVYYDMKGDVSEPALLPDDAIAGVRGVLLN